MDGKRDQDINDLIQSVLLLTLDVQNLGLRGPASAVLLSSSDGASKLDWENVPNFFFERVIMEAKDLTASVASNESPDISQYGRADQSEIVQYLGECFIRLQIERRKDVSAEAYASRLEELILQNLRLLFTEPDLKAPQDCPKQFLDFYFREFYLHGEIVQTFTQKFLENATPDFDNMKAGTDLLNRVQKKSKFTLMDMGSFDLTVQFLTTMSASPGTAKILMMHSVPKNPRDPESFEKTLLGGILRVSCLPDQQDVAGEFFVTNSMTINPAEVSHTEKFIWSNTKRIADTMFSIFNNIVRASPDMREVLLHWMGDCLSANSGKGKMWQQNERTRIRMASDGFILNMSGVLLRLCRPFIEPARNPRILKIHPLFGASGIYLRQMPEQTTVIPKNTTLNVEIPHDFGFISACFYLGHEALRLGWAVLWDQFVKLGRGMGEYEAEIEEARARGDAVLQQRIEQHVQKLASRHMSMRTALTDPVQMSLMIEFSVCTATWLSQMSVQPSGSSSSNLPVDYLPLFPVSDEPPVHLQFIPELIAENVLEILSCNSRLPLTTNTVVDWKYEWFEELMNFVLIPMLYPNRMNNPHLRAKMAMLMHNMMPHKKMADPYAESRHSLLLGLLDGHKERLFRDHPYKEYFLPAILEVFVSIEMTGQGLRFGEAYHYRRPLYALMAYLFTVDFHKERLERLAGDAAGKLDSTAPPLLLRFLDRLINDATYLLDEALNTLAKLKTLEVEKDSWASLPAEQRAEKEKDFKQQSSMAQYLNELGKETIHCLRNLTVFKNPSLILLSSVFVDRLAEMLNYFLACLVRPEKRVQYRVRDLSVYSFEPKDLVQQIIGMYVNLARHQKRDTFLLAICRDKRSYTPQLMLDAHAVLRAIGTSGEIMEEVEKMARDVQAADVTENEEEDMLIGEDIPDNFTDALMAHVMRDPVILPSSGQIVDRSTIARFLLSNPTDPFNRQPLTLDMVKPADELRVEIHAWLQKVRAAKAAKR